MRRRRRRRCLWVVPGMVVAETSGCLCHCSRSAGNASIRNAEGNCYIFYLSGMKDHKSVITDKKYADISIKSSRYVF